MQLTLTFIDFMTLNGHHAISNHDLGWFLIIYSVQSSETLSHLLSNKIVCDFFVSTFELEKRLLSKGCSLLCFTWCLISLLKVISKYNTTVLSSLSKCKTMMYAAIKYMF